MKVIRRVEVDWIDSISWPGWRRIEDVVSTNEKYGLNTMKTSGYLVQDHKDYITVAQSLSFDSEDGKSYRGADFMCIPRACIKKITKH